MKAQKSFSKRLKLSKETVAQLGDKNMNEVKGGELCSVYCTYPDPCQVVFTNAPISECC